MGYYKNLAISQQGKSGHGVNWSAEAKPYIEAWTNKMVEIWSDKLEAMGIMNTGDLIASVQKGTLNIGDDNAVLAFKFLLYGIYVDLGVGNGYQHNNGGDLQILNPIYRIDHHLGKQRERRPWFSKSWFISCEIIKDKLADIMGEEFVGLFDSLLPRERG